MSVSTIAPISVKEFAGMMQKIGPMSSAGWPKTLGMCRHIHRVENVLIFFFENSCRQLRRRRFDVLIIPTQRIQQEGSITPSTSQAAFSYH